MTREEAEKYIGKVYSNKSHWNKDGKDFVKVIAYDPMGKRFYVQKCSSGVVDHVDDRGEGEWFECGGIWLKIDLNDPVESL